MPSGILHTATTGTDATIYFFIFRPFSLINKDSFISGVRPFPNELNSYFNTSIAIIDNKGSVIADNNVVITNISDA